VETDERRLFFIPGDSLLPGTANLPYFRKVKIIKELGELTADFVILDLGSGSSYNTIDFFLTSSAGIIVVTPEATSILNAYSFVKAALFRMIYRSFPAKSEQRALVSQFMTERLEGTNRSTGALIEELSGISAEAAQVVRDCLQSFLPRVVLNMGRTQKDVPLGAKLRQVARKNLDLEVQYIGFLPWDQEVGNSILQRRPVLSMSPGSAFARNLQQVTTRLIHEPTPKTPKLFEADEDLVELVEEASF
jgi:flagellar biosynthesis protein FlhG